MRCEINNIPVCKKIFPASNLGARKKILNRITQ